MKFFNKNIRKLEEQLDAACAQDKKTVEDSLNKAESVSDPVEKIMLLQRIKAFTGRSSRERDNGIETEVYKQGKKAGWRVMLPGSVGSSALILVLHAAMAPLALLGVPLSLAGAAVAESVQSKRVRKKLEARVAGHLEYMGAKHSEISKMVETLVRVHVSEISKSPSRDDVLKDYSLAKIFSEASAQKLVAQEAEVEALKKARQTAKAPKKTGQKMGDYDKFKDPLKTSGTAKPRTQKRRADNSGKNKL